MDGSAASATAFQSLTAVTFDCWSTLLYEQDAAASMQSRVEHLLDVAGERIDEPQAHLLIAEVWARHIQEWKAVRSFGVKAMCELIGNRLGLTPREVNRLTILIGEAPIAHGVRSIEGAGEVLTLLKEAGFGVGLVSDTGFTPGSVVRRCLRSAGLLDFFDVLSFSDEVGFPKPHRNMFAHALEGMDVHPTAAAHVGDLRQTDVAGAAGLGMVTIRFRGFHDDGEGPEADLVIDNLLEVLDVVGAGRSAV